MSRSRQGISMTEGRIVRTLILFILPLIGSSIFQQLYNTADFFFVGNWLGKTSAAAVGASSSLITCIIGVFTGIALGTNVVIAQAIGAGKNVDRTLSSSFLFGIAGGIVLMLVGVCFAPGILGILNTPENVMNEAVLYIRIYFLSVPASILYNICSGSLRACGDSKTPFHILVVCGIVNVLGDIFLIRVIPLGIKGVALATIISQWLSLLLIIRSLLKEGRAVRLSFQSMTMDWRILGKILRIGLPSGIQSMVVTLSNVIIQYYINGFGETTVAAFATYYRTESFVYLPIMAFGQAVTTFSGQNTGAAQYKRLAKGTGIAAAMGMAVTFCTAGCILTFPETVFGLFIKDSSVVNETIMIAMVSFPFYWLYAILEVIGGSLRGMGYSLSSMVIILVNLCAFRIGLLSYFDTHVHSLRAIASVYPITWSMAVVSFLVLFGLVILKKIKQKEYEKNLS